MCVQVPPLSEGAYLHNNLAAPSKTYISHSKTISLSCHSRFRLQGPRTLPCTYGSWAVPHLPLCFGVPCLLPEITTGRYLGDLV